MSVDVTWTRFVRIWRRIAVAAYTDLKWSPGFLRDLIARYPLPWLADRDWTWEVVTEQRVTIASGFRHEIDALDYIRAAERANATR